MRAATPKADRHLRYAGSTPLGALSDTDRVTPFPGTDFTAADLAGVTPLRHGRQRGHVTPLPANDAPRRLPPPLPQPLFGLAVALLDVVILAGAGLVADVLIGSQGMPHAGATLLVVVLALAGGFARGAYAHAVLFGGRRQLRRIAPAALGALAVTIIAAAAFDEAWRLEPAWIVAATALGVLGLTTGRAGTAALMRRLPRTRRRTVILGAGPQAARLATALRHDPAGLEMVGLVDERGARDVEAPEGIPLLGGVPQLEAMIRRGEVEVVVIALPWSSEARVTGLASRLSNFPVELRLAPDLMAAWLPRADRPPLPPLLTARPISGVGAAIKSLIDFTVALGALVVLAVPMLLVALAVKLDSPGPVLFRQRRIGFNDQPFDCFKFRTMYTDATDHEARRQVMEGDPRVTPVGALLRRTSLDELPQLFNVLRGEMSLVGPRPHAPGTLAGNRRFDEVVTNYASRHRVKPGLTGLAQVRGFRGPTPNEDLIIRRVESDLEYIARWSLWLDCVIILRTLLVVVRMRNAL
jgi:exopolysaccharide biosynthesis polyprenyl glycosylphosphotransferase